jgi:hypothetical protein
LTTACGAANETETISPATPTIVTAVSPTPIALGAPFHDTATLTGTGSAAPTGTVDFTVFGPNNTTCTGAPAFTSTGNAVLTAGGVTTATSPNFTPTMAGAYRVVAHYSGDANYTALTTACGAANETETVGPGTPTINTAVSPTPIALGQPFHDTATLTGTGGVAPTGTVDFTVFGPGDANCSAAPVFSSTGNAVSTTGGVTTATSANFTPTAAGDYHVVAHYSGDANYTALTSACGAANETETVSPVAPTVTTAVSPNPVALGGAFHDTATLTGSGAPPTGTVDFTVFGPNNTTCTGTPAFTSTGNAVSTTGGVTTATSTSFTPTAAGSYRVVAHYSGDANYGALTTACGAANETETISPVAPTINTAVSPVPITLGQAFHDTATLTGTGATAPTGTVDFTIYGPGDASCTGTPVFSSTGNPLTTSAGVTTATSPNFTPTAVGAYRVVAHYSGDANYNALTSACGAANETETVGPGTPTINTAVSPVPITVGQAFHDTATLTGTGPAPTGTVDFTIYGPGDASCTGTPVFTSTGNAVSTTGGVTTATSPSFTPTTAGSYHVVAHYSGDANYTALTSACGAPNETETVSAPGPIPIQTAATLAADGTATDIATVGPAPAGAPAPTGTVTFRVYGPGDATCSATPAATSTTTLVTAAGATTAASAPFKPASPGTYRFVATYSGDANYPGVASGCNDANESVSLPGPVIAVTKAASPPSEVAPGGTFTFTVVVSNPSSDDPITIRTLTDNIYGDLATRAGSTCGALIGVTLAPGATSAPCTFTGQFTGNAGASQTDTVTVGGTDSHGFPAQATAMATVTLTPVNAPMIGVTKVASPLSRNAPGGTFTFTVAVSNPSTTTPVTINQLVDNIYGNLATRAGSTCGALIGVTLAPGATSAPCSFSGPFSGSSGASQTDTVTVTGSNNGATVSATAQATVKLTAPGAAAVSPVSLHAPAACVTKTFTVYVTGTSIATVVYYLDGHRIKTVSKHDSHGHFSLTVSPAPLGKGKTHHLTAVVEPVPHSGQPLRTVRRTFAVCGAPVLPRFTG